ncbi:type I restriction endonuclease subunit R [Agaribacter marinus]|uniref:Restriction endonuclease subunit S n=1 Tax=Virgibacillus salarius TaxID=447199 RepID=A0A941DV68_9BACI|nr:restriction endonuclease subunit S [Virgibacillus salarius]MBR7797904.1 restriction endonuclease subunit S [Virgibacillus salarius]NAZ10614.1 type I restriction endonuclease subunit R [Agaribacter marinus]
MRLEEVKWGEYKLGDLFEIKGNPQLNKDSFSFNENGEYAYFTRTVFNNGIAGYVDYLDEKHKIKGNCLAVGMLGMKFFYMQNDFYAGQFTKRAIPKLFSLSPRLAAYFCSLLNKNEQVFKNVLVRDFERVFNKTKIQLPTKNGEIDFDFMESFIAELEAERIAELEDYLLATGLNDFELTEEEERVLRSFNEVEWKEYQMKYLFERIKTKKLPYKAKELPKEPTGKYILPCLTSSFMNQGLNYFAPKENATILENVISIPSNSDVYRAYFQSREFTVLSDAYAIKWIYDDRELSKNQYLFTVPCINEVTDLPKYSYKNKLGGWNVVRNKFISLPIKNNKPDYEFMETLISAIQKLVIKDVVLYANRKIDETKSVVNNSME